MAHVFLFFDPGDFVVDVTPFRYQPRSRVLGRFWGSPVSCPHGCPLSFPPFFFFLLFPSMVLVEVLSSVYSPGWSGGRAGSLPFPLEQVAWRGPHLYCPLSSPPVSFSRISLFVPFFLGGGLQSPVGLEVVLVFKAFEHLGLSRSFFSAVPPPPSLVRSH